MSISRRSFFRVLIIVVLLATFGIHAVGAADPAVGEARVGVLKVTPHKVNFKKLNLAKRSMRSKYIWVTNKGKGDLTVTFGSAELPFKIACSCQQVTIPPGRTARAIVAFAPDSAGVYSDTFIINSDAGKGESSYRLALHGRAFGSPPQSAVSVSGALKTNENPVANATVNLYGIGESLDGSDSALIATASTDSEGSFHFSRVYCANPSAQVYALSSSDSPSTCSSRKNAPGLMSILGTCAALSRSESIVINELTTAASALALAPFAVKSGTGQAATPNVLLNALAEAMRLVDPSTGQSSDNGGPLTKQVLPLATTLGSCAQCLDDGIASASPVCTGAFENLQAAFAVTGDGQGPAALSWKH